MADPNEEKLKQYKSILNGMVNHSGLNFETLIQNSNVDVSLLPVGTDAQTLVNKFISRSSNITSDDAAKRPWMDKNGDGKISVTEEIGKKHFDPKEIMKHAMFGKKPWQPLTEAEEKIYQQYTSNNTGTAKDINYSDPIGSAPPIVVHKKKHTTATISIGAMESYAIDDNGNRTSKITITPGQDGSTTLYGDDENKNAAKGLTNHNVQHNSHNSNNTTLPKKTGHNGHDVHKK